jgi:hypothetical protein
VVQLRRQTTGRKATVPQAAAYVRLGCAPCKGSAFQWVQTPPATAPAGSNRSSHGGNEVAEAFDQRVTNW